MEEKAQVRSDAQERVRDAWVVHHERLWRALLAWSGDREVASDALAEAFAQAIRRGPEIHDVGRWVWRSAFRIAGGLLADRGRHDRGSGPGATDGASLPEDAVVLLDALDHLSATDRQVVVLSLVGGWPSGAIADLVGATPGSVRVRLHRAKSRLRKLLEEDDG